jgi:hypothetical protein
MNFNRPPVDYNVSCYRCCGSGLITLPYSGAGSGIPSRALSATALAKPEREKES